MTGFAKTDKGQTALMPMGVGLHHDLDVTEANH